MTNPDQDTKEKLIKLRSHRAAGTIAAFRTVRSGTDRAHVLKLMNGKHTPHHIAVLLGGGKFTARYVLAHAYCLRRDCGIGYSLDEVGKLIALYPNAHGYEDTVKSAPRMVRSLVPDGVGCD